LLAGLSAKHRRIVVLQTDTLAFPQTFHIRLPCSKCAKKPVQPYVLGAVVAIKVGVVDVMVVVSRAWEDEAPMSKPSGEPTVNHKGDEDYRVDSEGHGEKASGQEDGVLDRVEAGAREGGRVVALVVQLVDVLVQEPARIWSRKPVEPPGMKKAVANVIVGLS